MRSRLFKLGLSNIRNKIAESLYIYSGRNFTRPVQVYAIINKNCNAKCIMCESWRSNKDDTIPAAEWNNLLLSLKKFSKAFHINFSGGEPLLKKDFLQILKFCSENKISAGLTTNGLLLNKKIVDELLALDLLNINISIDSMQPEIHDTIRGVPNMLSRVKANVEYLMKMKRQLGKDTNIIIKSIVSKDNLDDLTEIVDFCRHIGANGVNFQPIFRWSKEAELMFDVDEEKLERVISKLIQMKNNGFPIINGKKAILKWVDHFKDVIPARADKCVVSLRNLHLLPDGSAHLCGICNSMVGNIKDTGVEDMWNSFRAKRLRKALVGCKRQCTASCVVKRDLIDHVRLFLSLCGKPKSLYSE